MDTQFLAYLSFLFFGIILGSTISFLIAVRIHLWMIEDEEHRELDAELHDFIDTPFEKFRKSYIKIVREEVPQTEEEAKGLLLKTASVQKYKADLNIAFTKSVKVEDFSCSATLQNYLLHADKWHEERRHFFNSRIGKKIIANKLNCDCEHCNESFLVGIELINEQVALHCFMLEIRSNLECDTVRFIDR